MNVKRIVSMAVLAAVAVVSLAACNNGNDQDASAMNKQLQQYQKNGQGIQQFPYSQYRQNLINVEGAEANGIATTTFFFNMGNAKPIKTCASVGYPLPSTAQLSNPQVDVGGGATVGQIEPNGVYTGDSTGTYVACIAPNGVSYLVYWEGFVETEGGPAHWDATQSMIVLDGPPTVDTKKK